MNIDNIRHDTALRGSYHLCCNKMRILINSIFKSCNLVTITYALNYIRPNIDFKIPCSDFNRAISIKQFSTHNYIIYYNTVLHSVDHSTSRYYPSDPYMPRLRDHAQMSIFF